MLLQPDLQLRRRRNTATAIGFAVLCAVSACNKHASTPDAAQQSSPGQPANAAPVNPAVSSQVAAMGADQLKQAAGTALREQRLYAPAGNNAMEYYVALRDKEPNNAAVASALSDLMPYALIATEQSIARNDFGEAQRLYALMQKTDPHAPALPRLQKSIADGQAVLAQQTAESATKAQEDAKQQQQLEQQRLADQQKAQQQAAAQLAAAQLAAQQAQVSPPSEAANTGVSTATPVTESPVPATTAAADTSAAAKPSAPATPPPTAAPVAKPTPPPVASSEIRPISTPSPHYPPDALRAGQGGEVQVEFTINPDGSVGNVRVVRGSPPHVFDRAATAAVKTWRFQPIGSAVTTRRTIGFTPAQ